MELTVIEEKVCKSASDALAVQSACNLSGVVYSFKQAMDGLNEQRHTNGNGTIAVNEHAICRLFAEQIMHLTSGKSYSEAYTECQELAAKLEG